MSSRSVASLADALIRDVHLREKFRAAPAETASPFHLNSDELHALSEVDWAVMSDREMLVRLSGAARRGTHQTA